MAYRERVFISFDGDNDIHYYRLMKAWKQNDRTDFSFVDAHELSQSRDSSQEESIKRSLRDRLTASKVFVSLVGESTRYLYKFVRWEIEQAIGLRIPIIVVNLNGRKEIDAEKCPPLLRDTLAVHVSFGPIILQHALESWPNEFESLRAQGFHGARHYAPSVYVSLGMN